MLCAYRRCKDTVLGPGLRVLGLTERGLVFCGRACLLGHYAEVCAEPAPWPTKHRDSRSRLDEQEDVTQPYKAVTFLSAQSGLPLTGMTATPARLDRALQQAQARLDGLYAAASARLKAAHAVALSDCPAPLQPAEPLPDLIEALTA